ncbi:MAG: hypothetical protein LUQ59_05650, partial [Methanothrix sp.]|nr:hypothetical protein [Methanothrix sp.]
MDHEVHINNGDMQARPLVLRLLPGEETIFNLKVINHGEPSNISLQASSPVFKAVRLRKPDHYVVMEEVIPIMARMPANSKRLDGEILLTGGGRESRVPITLLRDSEDPGDDLEDPGLQRDEECRDDSVGEDLVREDSDDDGYDEEDAIDVNDEDIDDEDSESPGRRRRSEGDEEDEEKEPRRIAFSRDRDLQSYRAARMKRAERAAVGHDSGRPSGSGRAADRFDKDCDEDGDDDNDNRIIHRYSTRIDDRFVDRDSAQEEEKQEEGPSLLPRQVRPISPEVPGEQDERPNPNSGYEEGYQDYRQEADRESREIIHQAEKEAVSEEPVARTYGAGEEYYEQEDESSSPSSAFMDKLDGFSGPASIKTIPAAIFLALVAVLVLTFIVESIPEFAGALGSSILIVTL